MIYLLIFFTFILIFSSMYVISYIVQHVNNFVHNCTKSQCECDLVEGNS